MLPSKSELLYIVLGGTIGLSLSVTSMLLPAIYVPDILHEIDETIFNVLSFLGIHPLLAALGVIFS